MKGSIQAWANEVEDPKVRIRHDSRVMFYRDVYINLGYN